MGRVNPIIDDELDEYDPLDEYEAEFEASEGTASPTDRSEMLIEELGEADEPISTDAEITTEEPEGEQQAEILAMELESGETDIPGVAAPQQSEEVGAELQDQFAQNEQLEEVVEKQLEQTVPPPEPVEPSMDERLSALVQAQMSGEYGSLRTRRGALREGTGVG